MDLDELRAGWNTGAYRILGAAKKVWLANGEKATRAGGMVETVKGRGRGKQIGAGVYIVQAKEKHGLAEG